MRLMSVDYVVMVMMLKLALRFGKLPGVHSERIGLHPLALALVYELSLVINSGKVFILLCLLHLMAQLAFQTLIAQILILIPCNQLVALPLRGANVLVSWNPLLNQLGSLSELLEGFRGALSELVGACSFKI